MSADNKNPQPSGPTPAKKETARIALDKAMAGGAGNPSAGTAPISGGDAPSPVKTIRLKKPPTAPLFVKSSTGPVGAKKPATGGKDPSSTTTVLRELSDAAPPTVKKETSRIVLRDVARTSATPLPSPSPLPPPADKSTSGPITGIPLSPSGMPQTIRLKKPSTSNLTVKPADLTTAATRTRSAPSMPGPGRPPTARVLSEAPTVVRKSVPDASSNKSETSRIVLDDAAALRPADARSATAPITGVPSGQSPQTIRLKRPSDALAVKDDQPAASSEEMKSQTAKIDLPAQSDAPAAPLTQRKTIKIKRTERNVAPRTLVLKRSDKAGAQPAATAPAADAAADAAAEAAPAADAVAGIGWSFSAVAALVLICLALLAYLLAAQSMGPDVSLPVPEKLM